MDAITSHQAGMTEHLILVDRHDRVTGSSEKLAAHREGLLHRAFSVFIFDSQGRLLLQRRADGKYHSGGLWTNTCCSHPRPGEETMAAARRRLREEMGLDCELRHVGEFIYQDALDNNLVEHEYDHLLIGFTDHDPVPAPDEASDWRWLPVAELRQWFAASPGQFTAWFRRILADGERFDLETWSRRAGPVAG